MNALRALASRPSPVLFACMFASQAGLLVLSPVLPDIAHEFGTSTAVAGQLRTVAGATGGVTALALALAGRRPALRTLPTRGALLLLAGSVLSAVAPSFALLALAQGVLGIGIGLLVAIGIAAAGEWPSADERAKTLAWAIAGMPVAWVVGMPIAGLASSLSWRASWLVVPAVAALVALASVRLRPADAPSWRTTDATAAWRRPEVARFSTAELLANAGWASVLTYCGALLIESYGCSRTTVAIGLGIMAAAMVPGTFVGRRSAPLATVELLAALTLAQGGAVVVVGAVRPAAGLTLSLLMAMAFINGWRSVVASSIGMDAAEDDKVAVMSMRASANQFGYLLGAAVGALALTAGGFAALGGTLAALFAVGAFLHYGPLRDRLPLPAGYGSAAAVADTL
jgi:MFS transporter, DHA1 family, inner membrane transport protein